MPFVPAQKPVVGNTIDFTLNAQKDGEVWDITGGTVTLYLIAPDGTVKGPYTATLSSPTTGVAHYQVADDVIDAAGTWNRQWVVVVAGIDLASEQIPFTVYPRASV